MEHGKIVVSQNYQCSKCNHTEFFKKEILPKCAGSVICVSKLFGSNLIFLKRLWLDLPKTNKQKCFMGFLRQNVNYKMSSFYISTHKNHRGRRRDTNFSTKKILERPRHKVALSTVFGQPTHQHHNPALSQHHFSRVK